MMRKGRVILEKERFALTLNRLCQQLIENHGDFKNTCVVGIQPRGIHFSDRIYKTLTSKRRLARLPYGQLDITFYRDDFRTRSNPIRANHTKMDFLVENRRVILIDDVLFSGRTIQAALAALQHYGRPESVELLTLVDRRFNRHLPIQADYVGIRVDALDEAYVKVIWSDQQDADQVLLFSNKEMADKYKA